MLSLAKSSKFCIIMSSWSSKAEEANEAFEPEVELREVSTNNTLVNDAVPFNSSNLPHHITDRLSTVNANVDSSGRIYDAAKTAYLDVKPIYW